MGGHKLLECLVVAASLNQRLGEIVSVEDFIGCQPNGFIECGQGNVKPFVTRGAHSEVVMDRSPFGMGVERDDIDFGGGVHAFAKIGNASQADQRFDMVGLKREYGFILSLGLVDVALA